MVLYYRTDHYEKPYFYSDIILSKGLSTHSPQADTLTFRLFRNAASLIEQSDMSDLVDKYSNRVTEPCTILLELVRIVILAFIKFGQLISPNKI